MSIFALSDIGPGAPAAVQRLIDYLVDPRFRTHHHTIVTCLSRMGSPAVKPLMAKFEMATPYARYRLIWALTEIGPPAMDAIPLLEQQTRDKDKMVRDHAAYAIRRIRFNRR